MRGVAEVINRRPNPCIGLFGTPEMIFPVTSTVFAMYVGSVKVSTAPAEIRMAQKSPWLVLLDV